MRVSRKALIMMERDQSRAFLDKQLQSRDARITMLELQLSKKKDVMEQSKGKKRREDMV